MAEHKITGSSLYDINKQIMVREKPFSPMESAQMQQQLTQYFFEQANTYFMLLCHEQRDYTVLRITHSEEDGAQEIMKCLLERGDIIGFDNINNADNSNIYEIWVTINNEAYVYYLFPYDAAIIEV